MAWSFGDGFDLYNAVADMCNGYWDGTPLPAGNLVTGRFAGSRAIQLFGGNPVNKTSGVNDAVHHFVVSLFVTSAGGSNTSAGAYVTLFDGTTAQCSIVFCNDNALRLEAGAVGGTVLATFTGAIPAAGAWYAFEVEVVINNTTGSITVRRNGNSSNDFTATGLNTRASANNYANKVQLGLGSSAFTNTNIDDFFWRSDVASVGWMGDIRCYTRMPFSNVSTQFSVTGTRNFANPATFSSTTTANGVQYSSFIMTASGAIASATFQTSGATYTGNVKCALNSDGGSGPGAVLGSATNIVTNPPINSTNTFTFSPPIAVSAGQRIWLGFCFDTTNGSAPLLAGSSGGFTGTVTYASFPIANPVVVGGAGGLGAFLVTVSNAGAVNEPQQDALTTYVYDSVPGHADFYSVASIPSVPALVLAVTTRGYMQKSDAGTRTAAVQVKSGATTVVSPTVVLTPSNWQWAWRTDLTDPSIIGATWSPSDKSSTTTLSGGNLIATSGGSNTGVRGTVGLSAGKFYFEVTVGWSNFNDAVGIANGAAALGNGSYLGACVVVEGGAVFVNGVSAGISFGTITGGSVIGIAIDIGAQLAWFRVSPAGNWNANATYNPATGVGGVSFSTIGGVAMYPYGSFVSTPISYTANFGASGFSGTVPAGFTSGWSVAANWTPSAVDAVQIGPLVVS